LTNSKDSSSDKASIAWKCIGAEPVADCEVFKVKRNRSLNPRDNSEHFFYCIEAPDWVNIIPLTSNNEIIMIEQYRHGADIVTLEIPGGVVDKDESPHETAMRELLEETGYLANNVRLIGRTYPNPALQNNVLHTFVAHDVEYHKEQSFDLTEHTVVQLVPVSELPFLIANGKINHSLIVNSLYWFTLYQQCLL
jgi:ADP-ribose pyrophosphatase